MNPELSLSIHLSKIAQQLAAEPDLLPQIQRTHIVSVLSSSLLTSLYLLLELCS